MTKQWARIFNTDKGMLLGYIEYNSDNDLYYLHLRIHTDLGLATLSIAMKDGVELQTAINEVLYNDSVIEAVIKEHLGIVLQEKGND